MFGFGSEHSGKAWGRRVAVALAIPLLINLVVAQTTPAPPGSTAAPVDDFRSIYSNGDLILVNPQQSTVIFLSVIVSSTLLEWAIEVMGGHPNKYIRIIFFAVKEEATCIAFTEMVLLFVAFSFDLSRQWRVVIQWVVMCLLFLVFAFTIMVTVVVMLLRVQARRWRTFEWAKIEADATHDTHEQIFKLSRAYFLHKVMQKLSDCGVRTTEIPLVAFSAFIGRVERRLIPGVLDFTLRTWAGLGLVIVLNGARSVTAASVTSRSTLVQILTFVFIIGYGILVAYAAVHLLLTRRLRQFMLTFAVQLERGETEIKSSSQSTAKVAKNTQQCLYFRSPGATFELIKVLMLSMVWYVAVLIMAYVYVSFSEVGWYALLIYAAAAVPPVVMTYKLPWTLNVVTICVALGDDMENRTGEDVSRFLASVADSDSEQEGGGGGDANGGVDGRGNDTASMAPIGIPVGMDLRSLGTSSPARDIDDDDTIVGPGAGAQPADEWTGRDITLHSLTPPDHQPTGDPQRLMGVPPSESLAKKFEKRQSRPVFSLAL